MPCKHVSRVGRRFLWNVHKRHVRFFGAVSAFAMIAGRAGRHHVRPSMLAALVFWLDMIHRQTTVAPSAILTGIIIPPEDFAASQLDVRARAVDLNFKADDRWSRKKFPDRVNIAATICHHRRLASQDQTDGSPGGADIDGFKICIED